MERSVSYDRRKNGGNFIVQYLKSNSVGLNKVKVGPYPFMVNAGTRVTEENAEVKFLLPNHSVLNYPNKITEKDLADRAAIRKRLK